MYIYNTLHRQFSMYILCIYITHDIDSTQNKIIYIYITHYIEVNNSVLHVYDICHIHVTHVILFHVHDMCHIHVTHIITFYVYDSTEWRRLIGCLKLQVIFRKRATNSRALLRKMTYEDKASCDSTPPCMCYMYMIYVIYT